jgi:hypothetical protein
MLPYRLVNSLPTPVTMVAKVVPMMVAKEEEVVAQRHRQHVPSMGPPLRSADVIRHLITGSPHARAFFWGWTIVPDAPLVPTFTRPGSKVPSKALV